MTQARGGRILLDYEVDGYGIVPTTKKGVLLPISTFNFKKEQAPIKSSKVSDSRNPAKPTYGFHKPDGSSKIPLGYRSLGYWLKALFGPPATTNAGSVYTHVFKYIKGVTIPSILLSKEFTDVGQYFLITGGKLGALKFGFGGENEVTADMDISARDEVRGTTAYNASAIALVDESISPDQISVKEGGVLAEVISGGEFNLETGLDKENFTTASGMKRYSIPEGEYSITGNLTALFTNGDLLAKAEAHTPTSMEIKYTKSADMSFTVAMNEVLLHPTSPAIEGPGGVKISFNYSAYHQNDASGSAVIFTLVNDIPNYDFSV